MPRKTVTIQTAPNLGLIFLKIKPRKTKIILPVY